MATDWLDWVQKLSVIHPIKKVPRGLQRHDSLVPRKTFTQYKEDCLVFDRPVLWEMLVKHSPHSTDFVRLGV